MSEKKEVDWSDLELCREWLRKYDSLIHSWLENSEATLSKSYILKRIWNQILDIYFRKKDNIVDLLRRDSKERKEKIDKILIEYERERLLEEEFELLEEELAELEGNFTLRDLEDTIEELRKKSYPRRLKELEELEKEIKKGVL